MWIPGTTLESVEPAMQYDGCIGCFNSRQEMISRFLAETQTLFTGFEIWSIISLSHVLFAWISSTWLNKQIPWFLLFRVNFAHSISSASLWFCVTQHQLVWHILRRNSVIDENIFQTFLIFIVARLWQDITVM